MPTHASRPLFAHESMRFARIRRVHECHEYSAELLEVDGLGDVAIEACVDALLVNVAKNVGGESDDRLVLFLVALLPSSNLLARLIAVLVWHVKVALKKPKSVCGLIAERKMGVTHQNERVVAVRLIENFVCALHTIHHSLNLNADFA